MKRGINGDPGSLAWFASVLIARTSSVSLRILDQGTLIFNCVLVICRCKEEWCRIPEARFTQLALQYHYRRDRETSKRATLSCVRAASVGSARLTIRREELCVEELRAEVIFSYSRHRLERFELFFFCGVGVESGL